VKVLLIFLQFMQNQNFSFSVQQSVSGSDDEAVSAFHDRFIEIINVDKIIRARL